MFNEYDDEALEADRRLLTERRETLAEEATEHAAEYRRLIQKAVDASEAKRQEIAQQAKLVKKKYRINSQRHQKTGVQLATVLVVAAARRLFDAADAEHPADDEAVELPSPEAVDYGPTRKWLLERLTDHDIDFEVLEEVQSELGVEIVEPRSASGPTHPRPHPPAGEDGLDPDAIDLDDDPEPTEVDLGLDDPELDDWGDEL